jgi:hypothetical protein
MSAERELILGNNVDVLKGKIQNDSLILIPYYLWSNRGIGKMKVWIPVAYKH